MARRTEPAGSIPQRLFSDFIACMEAADNDDLPDGAWFQVLEDCAESFMKTHHLRGDSNDAAHQYLRHIQEAP